MSQLTPDQLEVGLVLYYKGDDVPFVQARHLITKGQKTGQWLLPAFIKNDAMPAGGEWVDVPGQKNDRYSIVKIERNRVSKRGKRLDDIVWIVGDGYDKSVQFGLGVQDTCAKFGLLSRDPLAVLGEDKVDERIKEHLAAQLAADAWLQQQRRSAW